MAKRRKEFLSNLSVAVPFEEFKRQLIDEMQELVRHLHGVNELFSYLAIVASLDLPDTYLDNIGRLIVGVKATAPVTLTLPFGATAGTSVVVKDENGNAATNNITVSIRDGGSIQGGTQVINTNRGYIEIYSKNTGIWQIMT